MTPKAQKIRVMGILNMTPDSFSDGGRFQAAVALEARVESMLAAGADIIDVGGESTRPGAAPVPAAEELDRVLPAIRAVRRRSATIPVSIDTSKAAVARAALAAGATMINDVTACRFDPEMAEVVRSAGTELVVMHMQGTPRTMQEKPTYGDVVSDISDFFEERLQWLAGQGIPRQRVILDPGLGFGKTVAHNLTILQRLPEFARLGCPLLIGHSRKAFLGKVLGLEVGERDLATAVVSALSAWQGAAILRVHDVAGSVQAVRLVEAIRAGMEYSGQA